jgi:geranyl-CoA carboxylase alpha subunit
MQTKNLTPFSKILIANRGEIALRIHRTARAIGLKTVSVYSDADANSLHRYATDESVHIGASLPAQSYLNIAAIIAAAQKTGAQAIHPGYGFLAENEVFAQQCKEAGLVFIGPSAQSIAAMGDKANAKALMLAAGVPCIPGFSSAKAQEQTTDFLSLKASIIGYPLMIKACAGGGGRGMRLVREKQEFAELLRSAKSEALNSFGDDTVLLEKAIANARHIEIQVVADRYGHAIHLGERDCSVQRRHQKIIEESPSPAVSADLREIMGAIAVNAVKAIGYEGVGTLEFLLDDQGQFYFMEMNTRLQVEHPVTEAITGLDLVALQLSIAAGEPLALQQTEVTFNGHAIEVRLCAEDTNDNFTPVSGKILHWELPHTLRVEHAIEAGTEISPFYDSMIAKVIAHGANREQAIAKLQDGLTDICLFGLASNKAFISRCLQNDDFASGKATTGFIGAQLQNLTSGGIDTKALACAAALVSTPSSLNPHHDRLHHKFPRSIKFNERSQAPSKDFTLSCVLKDVITGTSVSTYTVSTEGQTLDLSLDHTRPQECRASFDQENERLRYFKNGNELWLDWQQNTYCLEDKSFVSINTQTQNSLVCTAATPGRVIAVHVQAGQKVEIGQALVTIEAMKMERIHYSTTAGEVAQIHIQLLEQVKARQTLVTLASLAPLKDGSGEVVHNT